MERNKIHQTTSIVITNYEDEDVTTTEQEEHTEVTLSYKQASFPGNLKKNLQNRYCSEKQVDAGSSQSNSPFQEFALKDLPRYSPSRFTSLEIAGSSQNSPSQELRLKDLPRYSPSRFTSLETAGSSESNSPSHELALNDLQRHSPTKSIKTASPKDDNNVIIELAAKVHAQERPVQVSPDFPKMPSIQKGHYSTQKQGLELLHKGEIESNPIGISSPKYFRSEMTIGPKEQSIYESQNTKQQRLHQYSPGFPSPVFISSANSSLLRPVPKASNIFNFDMPYARFHLDRKVSSAVPTMSPGINLSFLQSPIKHNPMSEMNQLFVSPLGMSSLGMYPSQSFNRSLPKIPRRSVLEQNHHHRRTLSDSDAYSCPVCNQVFFSYDSLAKHMVKHLGTETVPHGDNNNKGHYCSVCNRSFSRSDMLTRHMRLHTGIKPYECSDCGQQFSRSDHLKTHERTHTGEKPYRCNLCPYTACRRDMITRHMRTHYKNAGKRVNILSVPERDEHVRNSSVSSTETIDSKCTSSTRTFSQSSLESGEYN
ncbi:zinc finger protein Gfi-1b-like [Mytilus trossulus]|uniref:zinc finger protein Gfi-1b-like n=1 Tax=Mytilus trossulus TaxID=6551 RepID=UPI003007300E